MLIQAANSGLGNYKVKETTVILCGSLLNLRDRVPFAMQKPEALTHVTLL